MPADLDQSPLQLTGPGTPLSAAGVSAAAARAGTGIPELWAVIAVETSGCGFLPDRRPKVLFERHVFCRLTSGRFDGVAPDVSQPTRGGYGAAGTHQLDRLAAAMRLDETAALQSASWGLGQVMGENFTAAGFTDVRAMAAAMVASEDAQLLAMAAFLAQTRMAERLRAHDWAAFARRYNGPDYAAQNYDELLHQFYALYAAGPLPDLSVRTAQVYLMYRGLDPGEVDGVAGPRTAASVRAFQAAAGMPQTGAIDEALLAKLQQPIAPPIAAVRDI